jgi:hypothetical protein
VVLGVIPDFVPGESDCPGLFTETLGMSAHLKEGCPRAVPFQNLEDGGSAGRGSIIEGEGDGAPGGVASPDG